MRPLGSGIDIVEISRIDDLLAKQGDRFAEKILHTDELSAFYEQKNKAAFLAKRFAVKEAASKALGVGIGRSIGWQDIYVSHTELGQPILNFSEACQQRLPATRGTSLLSISDERAYAVAHVLLFAEEKTS
ncbi:holo-ACP synthase [Gammaproteobacteria bacterium]|nr:holo-ACP synthase [Pseudomonadota bacterium]MDB0064387.1 holo-ACP synthase [Gammaproteobacteria bacterium]MDC1284798.1 holo-ACP synthase [Gammaproteobacteria bacterium]